jgi:DnaJ-class molecular chaperone
MDRQTENVSKFSAQKCPVCNGFGTLKYGQIKCQGCNGKGFVVINNETGLPVVEKDGQTERGYENENNSH